MPLRHSLAPALELRAATPVWQDGEPGRYDEVEPWAWARLNQRLRAVERKRRDLSTAAA